MINPNKALIVCTVIILLLAAWLYTIIDKSNVKETKQPIMMDYQLQVFNDSIIVWDGDRKVDVVKWSDSNNYSELENALLTDNL